MAAGNDCLFLLLCTGMEPLFEDIKFLTFSTATLFLQVQGQHAEYGRPSAGYGGVHVLPPGPAAAAGTGGQGPPAAAGGGLGGGGHRPSGDCRGQV